MDACEQLVMAELDYHQARAVRQLLSTLTALASVAPWLRSLEAAWVPRALVGCATATWAGLLLATLASGIEEWHLRRRWRRCRARMAESRPDR
jgi:hypothetical protein